MQSSCRKEDSKVGTAIEDGAGAEASGTISAVRRASNARWRADRIAPNNRLRPCDCLIFPLSSASPLMHVITRKRLNEFANTHPMRTPLSLIGID